MSMPVPAPLVVVVDDDPAVRTALAFSIEMEGYRVATCDNAATLLAFDLPLSGACLVIDERLPDGSGLETLAKLRAAGCALPAAVITSHPNRLFRHQAARVNAPILEKPLIEDGLIRWIREATVAH
ncbi:MAG: response regulator [Proteobacteria bacterium]|nr:response regulator [Pseudomonadota bacterium]